MNDYYKHFKIDVLNNRYANSSYYEVAGSITFQSDNEKMDDPEYIKKWYGRSFRIETNEIDHISYMLKIAKHIDKSCYYDVQPEELLKVIGAEEYVIHYHEFVPLSNNGMNLYDIVDFDRDTGNVWTRIYCANDIIAQKETELLSKKNNTSYTFKLKESNVQLQSNLV